MTKRGEQAKRWREANREKYDAYQKEYREKYYQENKDRLKEKSKLWYDGNKERAAKISREAYERKKQANPMKVILDSACQRAKKKGLAFDLVLEDINPPELCPILGVPLASNTGHGHPNKYSPSLDKIVPSLGYVKGNIQVISYLANRMKQDATKEELIAFARGILKLYGEDSRF